MNCERCPPSLQQIPTTFILKKAVRGTAATKVPQGTLFHSYEINEEGNITDADIITPTAQKLAQVESDIAKTVQTWLDSNKEGGMKDFERIWKW